MMNFIYRQYYNIDTKFRMVNPIKVIKFSDNLGIRNFYSNKSILFDTYLRSYISYKFNNNGSILLNLYEKYYDSLIPDDKNNAISFFNINDVYSNNNSVIAIVKNEKHIFHVVRYLKDDIFYGLVGITLFTLGLLICKKLKKL